MEELSQYEKLRLKNIEENRRILAGLGLEHFQDPPPRRAHFVKKTPLQRKQGVKRKRPDTATPRAPKDFPAWSGPGYMTRSRRSQQSEGNLKELDLKLVDGDDDYEEEKKPLRAPRNRENVFGKIPGSPVGTSWSTRLACCIDGVHRPTVAGIHGNDEEGCYSLALSGGYEDDLDYGVCFTYTGEGGRDLKGTKANPKNLRTAPQSKDQTLTRGNLALSRNVENRRPVRVIRGYKLNSPYAPEEGYRYDGLYTVEKYWQARGLSGYKVYKFALKRCDGQAAPPWEQTETDASGSEGDCPDVEDIGGDIN